MPLLPYKCLCVSATLPLSGEIAFEPLDQILVMVGLQLSVKACGVANKYRKHLKEIKSNVSLVMFHRLMKELTQINS